MYKHPNAHTSHVHTPMRTYITCTLTYAHIAYSHIQQTNPKDLKIEPRDKVKAPIFLKIIYFKIIFLKIICFKINSAQ